MDTLTHVVTTTSAVAVGKCSIIYRYYMCICSNQLSVNRHVVIITSQVHKQIKHTHFYYDDVSIAIRIDQLVTTL